MVDVAGAEPDLTPAATLLLNRLVRLLALLLNAPIAGVSLFDGDRQQVAALWGGPDPMAAPAMTGPFCARVLAAGEPLTVEHGAGGAADYDSAAWAGAPLPGGVGVLWAADTNRRAWTAEDMSALLESAAAAAEALRLARDSEPRAGREQASGEFGAFEWWTDTGRTHWTPTLEALYGLPPGGFGGRYEDWAARVHPEDLPAAEAALQQTVRTGRPFAVRFRVLRPGGEIRWMLAYGLLQRDASGRPERVTGINVDISEQTWAQQEHAREQRLRAAITDNATLALFLMDERQHCTFMNPAAEQMTGFTLAEVQGRPLHEFIHHTHPDGQPYPLADCPIDRAFPTRRQQQGEEVFVHKDGHFYPVAFTASPLVEDGTMTGTVIEVEDITERRAAEAARRETEERYRALIEVSPQIVWMSEPDGRLMFVNQFWLDFSGMTVEESLGSGWLRAVHPQQRRRVEGEQREAMRRREPFEIEMLLRRADDEYCWHLARGIPQRDVDGQVVRWIGVATNIHGRKKIEEALKGLAAASLRIAAAGGLEETMQAITDEARLLIGARRAAISLRAGDRWPEEVRAVSCDGQPEPEPVPVLPDTDVSATFLPDRPVRLPRASGGLLIVPLLARDGGSLGHVQLTGKESGEFTADDEAVLVQLAQLAAVAIENARLFDEEQTARAAAERAIKSKNDLVSTVSHDLKTPLTSIKGMAQLLRRQARGGALAPETVFARLDSIDAAIAKMTAMLDELLDVARLEAGEPLTLQREPHDLVARVAALVEIHRNAAPGHQWQFLPATPELHAEVDGPRLDRVVDNLLSNAVKYTPPGGMIVVRVAAENDTAVIRVEDTGAGIPTAALPRIFERFYRAPNVARQHSGLGLGLAGARQIVELHGGAITAASEEGCGATFTVRLPCRAPADSSD